jgi:hypothetical protein
MIAFQWCHHISCLIYTSIYRVSPNNNVKVVSTYGNKRYAHIVIGIFGCKSNLVPNLFITWEKFLFVSLSAICSVHFYLLPIVTLTGKWTISWMKDRHVCRSLHKTNPSAFVSLVIYFDNLARHYQKKNLCINLGDYLQSGRIFLYSTIVRYMWDVAKLFHIFKCFTIAAHFWYQLCFSVHRWVFLKPVLDVCYHVPYTVVATAAR